MSFEDIRGQEKSISHLKSAIKNNKMASSYIFVGPKGSGRFFLASNFAKALNCDSSENIPCDLCSSCKKIDGGIHPDVRVTLPDKKGGEITIQSIRNIINEIMLKPYEGRYKVFIVKNARYLNNEAANSFLKTLEEPPQSSVLILITENPGDLPATIVSRCRIIRVAPLALDDLAGIFISEYGIERQKAVSLARQCGGRLGRFKEEGELILSNRDRALEKFLKGDFVETLSRDVRGDLLEELSILASWYRDMLVFKAAGDPGLVINYDRLDDIKRFGKSCSVEKLADIFNSVLRAKDEIENNINPKIALSAMTARGI